MTHDNSLAADAPTPRACPASMDRRTDEGQLCGYARVSKDDQDLSLQIDALTKRGIPKSNVFLDKMSGAKSDRPELAKCFETVQSSDRTRLELLPSDCVLAKPVL